MSVDWNTPDHEMLTRLTQNVFSFSAAKNYQELRTITDALRDDDGKLRSFADFKEQVTTINQKFNAAWLQTEYDTCIATATQSARWQEFKAQKLMFPYLRYQTAGDDSVRDEHRLLDGITKHVDDPFWHTYYPPNGWHCRCEAIQVPDDEVQESSEGTFQKPVIPPLFRTNCGETGLIFPQGHPYYDGVPNADIRQAIAYLPLKNGYIDFHMTNADGIDIPVHQHVMHGVSETKGNLKVLADFLNLKPEITEASLLPEIHSKDFALKTKFYPENWEFHDKSKNADAVLNVGKEQWVVDFKLLDGNGRRIATHLEKAYTQADYAIVELSKKNEIGIDGIRNSVLNKMKETKLKGVVVISPDGKLLHETYRDTISD